MNIAHAIVESGRRAQAQLSPLPIARVQDDAEALSQSASTVFTTLAEAGDPNGFNPADRLVHTQLVRALGDVRALCRSLAAQDSIPQEARRLLTELNDDTRLLQRELEDAHRAANSATAGSRPTPGKILIIDDDDANRHALARHLHQLGHEAETCCNSSQVFDLLEASPFDLIFLDLTMPGTDGLSVLSQLKGSERWRPIPVVMISGVRDEEAVIRCIEAGADDFLIKPLNRVLLNARLNAGLERKRWHDREQLYLQDLERSHRFIRDTFGRYVSEEIVDNILAQPDGMHLGGKTTHASILMADIRGFTTMAEQLPPSKVVRLLNNYLGVMSEIIMRHRGTIDEFIGDAILTVFGAPIACRDHADRAIACALEMQGAVSQINQENHHYGLPDIGIGIGINTGEVIAGNIGSIKRVKYGVVGHTVNLTSRIESCCRAGEILISQATLNAASRKVKHSYEFEISPKGMSERLKVCNITGYIEREAGLPTLAT